MVSSVSQAPFCFKSFSQCKSSSVVLGGCGNQGGYCGCSSGVDERNTSQSIGTNVPTALWYMHDLVPTTWLFGAHHKGGDEVAQAVSRRHILYRINLLSIWGDHYHLAPRTPGHSYVRDLNRFLFFGCHMHDSYGTSPLSQTHMLKDLRVWGGRN